MYKLGKWITSLELRIIFFKIFFTETDDSDDTFLTSWNETAAISEKFDRVDRTIMSADFADFVSMHDVTDVSLETGVTTSHGSHDSSDTSAHRHVEFRFVFVTEQRRNWNCVHR